MDVLREVGVVILLFVGGTVAGRMLIVLVRVLARLNHRRAVRQIQRNTWK